MFNVSDFNSVPGFNESFDCADGEEFPISLMVMQGNVFFFIFRFIYFPQRHKEYEKIVQYPTVRACFGLFYCAL